MAFERGGEYGGASIKSRPQGSLWLRRSLIVAAGLGLWFFTQSLLGARTLSPGDNEAGVLLSRSDGLFVLTAPINRFFHQQPAWADALLIVSSAAIDGLGIYLIAASIFSATMRPFIGLLILFGLRQLMQSLCVLPAPEGVIWRNPGVPSLLVTYHVANDFFFSGHTAVAVFGATQLARTANRWLVLVGVAVAILEIATVIVLRAHYTMDVFAGAAAALWVAHLADQLAPPLDRAIMKLGHGSSRWGSTASNRHECHTKDGQRERMRLRDDGV